MPKIVKTHPGPKTRKYYDLLQQYCPPHPFFSLYENPPVYSEAKGSLVKDPDGNIFLDFTMGYSSVNMGHCNTKIVEAAYEQMKKLHQTNVQPSIKAIELSAKLKEISPGNFPKATLFEVGGAGAVEVAMKIARRHTGKNEFITFYGGYHGRTLGAISLTAGFHYKQGIRPLGSNVWRFPYAYCYRCSYGLEYPDCDMFCTRFIRDAFKSDSHGICNPRTKENNIAGLFVEPIQGNAAFVIPPNEFYPRLKEICNEQNILMIDDEIQMAFGRTGKMFCCENYNVIPDVLILGKSLANGMWPLSAVLASKEFFKESAHTATFLNNPLGCAIGLACVAIIEKEKMCDKALKMGEYFLKGLNELKDDHKLIGDVQGKGLALAIEFVKNKRTKEPAVEESDKIRDLALSKGLIAAKRGYFNNRMELMPALTVTKAQIDRALEILDDSISSV